MSLFQSTKRFLSIEKTAIERAAELAIEVRFNNVLLYAAPMIVDEDISSDVVWVSVEWDTASQLAEQAIFSNQASTLTAKIESLAVEINPEWAKEKLSIKMDSFKNLQAELSVKLF